MIHYMVKATTCTYISQYYADRSFTRESRDAFFVGRFQGEGDAYRSFLEFDITLFCGSRKLIEKECPVFLRLSVVRNEISEGAIQAGIYRVLSPWLADTLTWQHQPAVRATPDISFLVPAGWTGLMLLDVNQLVQDWLEECFPNYGMMIKGDEQNNSLVSFNSSIYPGPRTAPVLFLASR